MPDLSGTYTPRAYVGASTALAAPLLEVRFADVPGGGAVNLAEAHITIGGQLKLATWLNEALRYRAEQQPGGFGYDHLITLIGSYAAATGVLIRFERRDGADLRVTTGGIDQDGRLQTSLYAWQDSTAVDPDATGRYSMDTSTGVAGLAVRQESDDRTWLRGRIAVTSSGTSWGHVVAALPGGHAPTHRQLLSVPTTGGIAAPCEIMTTGDIVVRRTQSGAFALSFDGLSYVHDLLHRAGQGFSECAGWIRVLRDGRPAATRHHRAAEFTANRDPLVTLAVGSEYRDGDVGSAQCAVACSRTRTAAFRPPTRHSPPDPLGPRPATVPPAPIPRSGTSLPLPQYPGCLTGG
ncbi:hypothetical protein [Salinispora arenicola]|uniref:hypothetical protein n=1 Tax=Salinispora arenicola TaxID=168697 RepID=UPI0027DE10EC|nr:hypothetical protein [Salinispora arenicola]